MVTNLQGKKALVTGGARRIGRAICLKLAREGVDTSFTYNSSAREAAETAREIGSLGVEVLSLRADLTQLEECVTLSDQVREAFGTVDILVNSASLFPKTELKPLDQDPVSMATQLDQLVSLHMRAPLFLGMRLGLRMKKKGWGRIINLTDRVTVSGQAYPDWIVYQATKYGLYGINQAMAVELSPQVTVNAVAPGLAVPPPELDLENLERLRDKIPLGREVGAEEIAADVLYLIRSEGKTGSTIVTDGGSSARTF